MKMMSMTGASTPLMFVLVMAILASAVYSATPTDLAAQAAWGVTAANPPSCGALKKPTVVRARGKTVP